MKFMEIYYCFLYFQTQKIQINTAVFYDSHNKNHAFTYGMEHFKAGSLLQSFSVPVEYHWYSSKQGTMQIYH